MEESQRGERAGSLPFCLPELPRRTGEGKKEEARKKRREGRGGQQRGSKESSLQARKEGKNTAARIQRDHKPYASSSRKSESASARPLRGLGPDSPQTCPNHPQAVSRPLCSGRPLIPSFLASTSFPKTKTTQGRVAKASPNRPIHSKTTIIIINT